MAPTSARSHVPKEIDADSSFFRLAKTNFQGPGYIRCPIPLTTSTTVVFDNERRVTEGSPSMADTMMMMEVCDSIHMDPSCSTLSSCDLEQPDVAPFVSRKSHNDDDDDEEEEEEEQRMLIIIVPLICDCIKVYGCPSTCTWIESYE